jgi:glycosyltransferase involved in cell wall biosynthesis
MHVCFLIRRLGQGGAERQLLTLVRGLDRSLFQVSILTFYDGGEFWDAFSAVPGIKMESLKKKGRLDFFSFLPRLVGKLRALRPDVVHGYLIGGNLFAVLAKPWLSNARIFWGIRTANPESDTASGWDSRLIGLERLASRYADIIICNSKAGSNFYIDHGLSMEKIRVIPNGIDIGIFKPIPGNREIVRQELGIPADVLVIGMVGRLVAVKDHGTFLEAALLLSKDHPNARFIIVGSGNADYEGKLKDRARELGLGESMLWLGLRNDIHRLYHAMDICVSASRMEGFPNVIGEAMASGVPVVCTDVGDCAWIVEGSGGTVPIAQPVAMAKAMQAMIPRLGVPLSTAVRNRIERDFSVRNLVQKTRALLLEGAKG